MGESITYDEMLEDFEYYYPHLASNVVEAYQKSSSKLCLIFDDGSTMIYDYRKKKGRMTKRDYSDEIRKSDKRREE